MFQNSGHSDQEYKRRISAAMNFISKNLFRNPSLEEIARAAHFSKFHFHRLFKAYTGETVAEFTRRIRLEQAINLLCYHPGKNITDIAFDCGFSSSQNFAKQFAKRFGVSPSQFRQNHLLQKDPIGIKEHPSPSTEFSFPLTSGNHPPSKEESIPRLQVDMQSQSAFEIAYMRFIGPYQSDVTHGYISRLIEVLTTHQMEKRPIIGVAWDNPDVTPVEKCRYDIGILVKSDERIPEALSIQELPAGDYAVYHCEVSDNDLERPWDDFIRYWLPSSGYILSGSPGYEVFHEYDLVDPTTPWIMELCLPLVPL